MHMHRRWRKIQRHHRSPASNCLTGRDRMPGILKERSIPKPAKISFGMAEVRIGWIPKQGRSSVQLAPSFSGHLREQSGMETTTTERLIAERPEICLGCRYSEVPSRVVLELGDAISGISRVPCQA